MKEYKPTTTSQGKELFHAARRQQARDASQRRTRRQPSEKSLYHLEECKRLLSGTPAGTIARVLTRMEKN